MRARSACRRKRSARCTSRPSTSSRDWSHAPGPVRHLNIGGGYGIPYTPDHQPLDLKPIGETLQTLLDTVVRRELPEARVVLELGRFLVGEAGIYVTRIIDRKVSRGRVFLITDGGLHHQLAASGNFGQVIRRNYPVAIGNRIGVPEEEEATVVGCLCTPLDLLADKVRLPVANPGDLFVVFQSGAYARSASPGGFLEPSELARSSALTRGFRLSAFGFRQEHIGCRSADSR